MGRGALPWGLSLFLVASCSFDLSSFKAAGSGGAGASAATTGAPGSTSGLGQTSAVGTTAVTTDAASTTSDATSTATSTTATSTTATSTTASSTTAASTTAASTTSAATTTVASSSSSTGGGPTNLPICAFANAASITDTLSPYSTSLWTKTGAVTTGAGGTVLSMQGANSALLTLNVTSNLFIDDCALTVTLHAESGGEQRFRLNPPVNNQRIKYYVNGGERVLTFAGNDSTPVDPPFVLAYVSRNHILYAGYKKGNTWTLLDGMVTEGAEYAAAQVQLTEENGANGNSGTWKDFNLTKVALSDLGIP